MGASLSCGYGSKVLPLHGQGSYSVGCADMMVKDGPNGDTGIFMRIYYPVDNKDIDENQKEEDYALWIPRKEYLQGLAASMKIPTWRLQLISDWVIGEKRMPALWERPLSGSKLPMHQVASSFSMDDFAMAADPSFKPRKFPTSLSMQSFSQQTFPVIVFSHGLSGARFMYSTYCASLASYGFVVAAVEHRDFSSCWTYKMVPDPLDGRYKEKEVMMRILNPNENEVKVRVPQLHKRVSEMVKALHLLEELNLGLIGARGEKSQRIVVGEHFNWRQFKGRLDLSRAAAVGHSFGGATALGATAFSTDFQAAVVWDGWMLPVEEQMYERFTQPTLFLNSGSWQWRKNVDKMLKVDRCERTLFTFL
ncbi:unnamed protein product, partial [Mesorhabditis belari]